MNKNDIEIKQLDQPMEEGIPPKKSRFNFLVKNSKDLINRPPLIRVDRHGDLLSNFLSNFFRQLKSGAKASTKPATADHRSLKSGINNRQSRLSNSDATKNTSNMSTTTQSVKSDYRYSPDQIDWNTMGNLGLSREKLEKMGLMDTLLRGFKSDELVSIKLNLGSAMMRTDARISLQTNADGAVIAAIHGVRKTPNFNYPFLGHEFSEADKDNLLATGNMGRVVMLTHPKTGERIPSIISVDRLTNELVALRTDRINLPDEIKGVVLSEEQKQTLREGKPLFLEGMTSKKGEPFDTSVQFNAEKRYVEFLFDRDRKLAPSQKEGCSQQVPRSFRGLELNEEQYNSLSAGRSVYVEGLVDKKGKSYQGYIRYNKEEAKTEFHFKDPDKKKKQAFPDEQSKTQVAVNSEVKTNEATKHSEEPLQAGQTPKVNKKQEKVAAAPTKRKSRKVS